jgi:predicted aconitase
MGIYTGSVEEAVAYSARGVRVRVPTTTSTLCADLERPASTGCPAALAELQARIAPAHRSLGILETYTCTPQQLGFVPPFGSFIASVESSAIIYFNSVLGARTNRGGQLTRYSAVCGKYPLMGYLLDAQRRGTHLFHVRIAPERLNTYAAWTALGFHIGGLVGSSVPVLDGVRPQRQDWLTGFGAALATSGSVTLYHIVGVTPEARTLDEAFQGQPPLEVHDVTERDLSAVYEKLRTIAPGGRIDFVTLGCPHYNLEQLRHVAQRLAGRRVAEGVRFWVCTNRMTRKQAEFSGYVQAIEEAGALVVADTCPVESHMRQSTCREYGLSVPNVQAMVTDSAKMARYVGDLIGCKTALCSTEQCIAAGLSGSYT